MRLANGVANTDDPYIAGYIGPVTGNQDYIARFQIPATGTCTPTDAAVAVISLVATASSGLIVFSGCSGGSPFGDVLTIKVTDGATNVNRFRNETRPNGVKTVHGPAINPDTFNLFDNRVTFDGLTAAPVQPFGTQNPDGAKPVSISVASLGLRSTTWSPSRRPRQCASRKRRRLPPQRAHSSSGSASAQQAASRADLTA